MGESDVLIVVTAKDEASKVLQNIGQVAKIIGTSAAAGFGVAALGTVGLAKGLETLNDRSKGIGRTASEFLNLGSAMKSSVIGQGAQAIYNLGKTGAAAIATQNAFVGLSGGAWEAGENLKVMQAATEGVISKQGLMQLSTQMMNLGLATSREDMGNLASTAITLGDAMGMDATQAINLMTQAVARGRTASLVPLGIDIAKLTVRTKELTSGTSGLSQQQAILKAVMEQSDVIAAKMGDSFDEAADTFDKFEAQIADAKTEIAMRATPAIAGFLSTINTGMEEAGQWGMRLKQVGVAMYSVVANDEATYKLADAWGLVDEKIQYATGDSLALMRAGMETAGALDTMTVSTDAAAGAQENLDDSMGNVIKRIGDFKFDNESLWNLALASGASDEALMSLATTLGIASQTEIGATIEMQNLVAQFGAGQISAYELEQGLIRLRGEVENARISAEGFTTALSHIPRDIQVRLNMTGAGAPELPTAMTPAELARQQAGAAGGAAEAAAIRERAETARQGAGAPQYQHGTAFAPGGMAMVGEAGPEAVFLPRGSQVFPSQSSVTKSYSDSRSWNIQVNDRLAASMLIEQSRQAKLSRFNATM